MYIVSNFQMAVRQESVMKIVLTPNDSYRTKMIDVGRLINEAFGIDPSQSLVKSKAIMLSLIHI